MTKDERYQKRLVELKPLVFCIQSAIELFGRDEAKRLAKVAFDKYAEDLFVVPYKTLPMEERWPTFRDNIIKNADDVEYSIEKRDDDMVKVKYLRCLFLEVFRDYGLEDFVPLYCHTDYKYPAAIHPGITMTRTQTLAEGAPYCDHCWKFKPE